MSASRPAKYREWAARISDASPRAHPTFQLFANIGFALVMFVVGTHVPARGPRDLRPRPCARGAGSKCPCTEDAGLIDSIADPFGTSGSSA